MDEKKLKEESTRSMKEWNLAWEEFFKNKLEPETDEEDRKQQEEFYHWYNYIRKQSDTGKTPAEMYKEVYGKEPLENPQEPSRMMNFELDEDYNEEEDEEQLKEFFELADTIFSEGVWRESKEEIKEMSKREASQYMFRLGFFLYSKYMDEQMKNLSSELKNMPQEDIQKLINYIKKEKKNERNL